MSRRTTRRSATLAQRRPLSPRVQTVSSEFFSVYLSPWRMSRVVHWQPPQGGFACMPTVPLGKVQERPDAKAPTCDHCKSLYRTQKEN